MAIAFGGAQNAGNVSHPTAERGLGPPDPLGTAGTGDPASPEGGEVGANTTFGRSWSAVWSSRTSPTASAIQTNLSRTRREEACLRLPRLTAISTVTASPHRSSPTTVSDSSSKAVGPMCGFVLSVFVGSLLRSRNVIVAMVRAPPKVPPNGAPRDRQEPP